MSTSIDIIRSISHKVQQLVKERDSLQRENEKLLKQLEEKTASNLSLSEEIVQLGNQVAILKSATLEMDEKSKKEFEKRINHFIKDIDKVIAHLQS